MSGFARILLTGGGTGGHVNPALAIGRALAGDETQFLYVGVRSRAEAEIVPREGLPIVFVRAAPYPGLRPSPAWMPFLVNLVVGTLKALFIVRRFHPDVIVGTGGFASAPVMFAAAALRRLGLLRSRVYVHEQNAAPGRLNLLMGRVADRVFVSFPETLAMFPGNGFLSGYPLRRRIQGVSREAARGALDIEVPEGRQVVFAFGGSQGARTINRAVVDALGELAAHKDRLFVIHGTGLPRPGGGYDPGRETDERLEQRYGRAERAVIDGFYVHRPYFHHIEHVYSLADLAIVRGGAGTLSEVAALGLPAIVVPKVNLPGEHQVMNARALARSGGAVVLYEETRLAGGRLVEELDGHVLAKTVLRLLGEADTLARMGRSATSFIHGDALETIRRRVLADAGAGHDDTCPPAATAAVPALLGTSALLTRLERASAKAGAAYNIAIEIVSADDRAYYVSRAASLLASPSWESRNLGVKLIGLLQARDKLPLVLALLADRRPAAWYKRLLGGDYEQVGFIRRNALTTLGRLRTMSPEVERALFEALSDPYYEARAEAARTVARLEALLSDDTRGRLVARLAAMLRDRWGEVAAVAAESLGRVGDVSTALPALLALRDERHWIVRSAGLRGVLHLIERGKAGNLDDLERDIRGYVLTATDFRPEFLIKTSYAKVMAAIAARKESAR